MLTAEPTPPRRRVLTPIQQMQAREQVITWLGNKVIEPISFPPLINNLVLVAKKDGRIRVCVDCTPANLVTESLEWPLPRLQDVRYRTKGATWFARIDLRDAFFRISIHERYRHLTAFEVAGQAYQFRKMPFGLKTAPSTFQRWMDWGLSSFSEWALWYIDDILICATDARTLALREKLIRTQLRKMECDINEEKSETGKTTILFAGLQLSPIGVGPQEKLLQEVLNLPVPRNKTDMQSALGLVSYLRDFIPLAAHFTAMLYPNKQGLRMSNEAIQGEWARLCRHLVQATTINHHWRDGVDAELYTDASQYALGAIVLQQGRVVALAARKLSPAETRYSTTDREHLGLVFAAEKFRLLLHQNQAVTSVYSDHSALTTRKSDRMTPRQARWHTLVNHWMPKIAHVRGKCNPADFVSRWKIGGLGANFRT